jgi:hypothetical protein
MDSSECAVRTTIKCVPHASMHGWSRGAPSARAEAERRVESMLSVGVQRSRLVYSRVYVCVYRVLDRVRWCVSVRRVQ